MRIEKRKKLKIVPVILLILIICLLILFFYILINFKIKNIYINGNRYLKDEYIIEKANIKEYPSVVKNLAFQVKNRLINDIFIKDAKVSYSFLGVINIDVIENRVLFYNEHTSKYVLENMKEVDSIPYELNTTNLINFVPDITYSRLIEKFSEVKIDITEKISQIKYDPNEFDKERFLLFMDDGNYVYITLSKSQNINYYNDIYKTLNNKKGILYLDSGNHFQEFN